MRLPHDSISLHWAFHIVRTEKRAFTTQLRVGRYVPTTSRTGTLTCLARWPSRTRVQALHLRQEKDSAADTLGNHVWALHAHRGACQALDVMRCSHMRRTCLVTPLTIPLHRHHSSASRSSRKMAFAVNSLNPRPFAATRSRQRSTTSCNKGISRVLSFLHYFAKDEKNRLLSSKAAAAFLELFEQVHGVQRRL